MKWLTRFLAPWIGVHVYVVWENEVFEHFCWSVHEGLEWTKQYPIEAIVTVVDLRPGMNYSCMRGV